MAQSAKPIPEGFHTVTPHLVLHDATRAIDFYKRAFGAEELFRMPMPDGKVGHAEIRIGDSIIMLADEMPPMPGQPGVYKSPQSAGLSTAALYVYIQDVDAAFARAVREGCTVRWPVQDMFWGDRIGQIIDPFGHIWSLATRQEDLSPEEIGKRAQEFFARTGK